MPLQEVTALLLHVRLGMSVFQEQGKAHVERSASAQSYAQWGQQQAAVGWASLLYRIRAEERILAQDAGWVAYVRAVHFRLLPGLW
jgi:hypothetical protein